VGDVDAQGVPSIDDVVVLLRLGLGDAGNGEQRRGQQGAEREAVEAGVSKGHSAISCLKGGR
jgi:hypothetical protein